MKYYVLPKNEAGEITVISEKQGQPVQMSGVTVVDLPAGNYLTVISRGKEYPTNKIAIAIAAGQIKIEDIKVAE